MPGADYKPVIRIEGEAEVAYFYEWMSTPLTSVQQEKSRRELARYLDKRMKTNR